jgi:hypothetical protein
MVIPAHKQAVVPDDLVNLVPYASRVDAGVLPSRQLRRRGLGKKDWSSIYCVSPVSDLGCIFLKKYFFRETGAAYTAFLLFLTLAAVACVLGVWQGLKGAGEGTGGVLKRGG